MRRIAGALSLKALLLFLPGCSESGANWVQVPLRTSNQLEAGLGGGEGMQLIWGLSYAASNPQVVYLLSDTSQVWKSVDGGHSWHMKHRGFLANGGISLAVDPLDEDFVLVAGSVQEPFSEELADGIYRTQDGGDSWELVRPTHFATLDDKKGGLNFAFTDNGDIYAGTHVEGLLKSSDRGDSWSLLGILDGIRILDVKLDPHNPSLLFLATEAGLFKWYDDGSLKSPMLIGEGLPDCPRALAIRSDDPRVLYVTAGTSGVFKSMDGGESFAAINNGFEDLLGQEPPIYATYLTMSPINPDYLFVSFLFFGGNQPFFSHDGGASWQEPEAVDAGGMLSQVNDSFGGEFLGSPIAASPVDLNVALASGNGNHVERTEDGGRSWTYSGSGYSGGRAGGGAASFSWDPTNPNRFILFLTDFGAVMTKDGGVTFRNLKVPRFGESAHTSVGALDPAPNSQVIVTAVGASPQVLAVSRDEGRSWTQCPSTAKEEYYFLAFHPQDSNIIYADQLRSADQGNSWNALPRAIAAVFPSNGEVVYATESDGERVRILKSSDGGFSWEHPFDEVEIPEVYEIAVAPNQEDRLYIATGHYGIFLWDGDEWVQRAEQNGLEADRFGSVSTRFITIDPRNPNNVYAGNWIAFRGHSNGVFRSRDAGRSWQNVTRNLGPEFTPWALSVNPHNGFVYVGSSHGTWALAPPGLERPKGLPD